MNTRLRETREIALWGLSVSRVLQRIVEERGLDVIETPEYHAQGLVASFLQRNIPIVVRLHSPAALGRRISGVVTGGSRVDTFVSESLEYRLARRAALITAPSAALASDVGVLWKLDPTSIRVIPNPIDVDMFLSPPDVQRDAATILYVGRLSRRKGMEALADAVPANERDPGIWMSRYDGKDHRSGPGGISMKKYLQTRFASYGLAESSFKFRNYVRRSELPPIYGKSGIFVLPSLYESFGYTLLEAMASGCAVVATNVGGITEIVTDGVDGLLVPPKTPAALADAVIHLLDGPRFAARLGITAQATVRERFGQERVCLETASAYRRVCETASAGNRSVEHR